MNNKITLGKLALGLLFVSFYTGCDESTTESITQVNQVGVDVVSAEKDLPKCSAENEGAQAFVKGESSARVCVGEEWIPMASSVKDTVVLSGDTVFLAGGKDTVVISGDTVFLAGGKDTVYVDSPDFSCKTEALADSSGLKIVCNGDSIGVVLNGAKGDKGENGGPGVQGEPGVAGIGCSVVEQTDSAMTIACGTDTTKIQLILPKTDAEYTGDLFQKGFFVKGSKVYVHEISDGSTLKQVGTAYVHELTRDDGMYKFATIDLASQYSMIVFDGYYRNPVTGFNSNAPINMKMLTDMRKRSVVNVNLLTHLEYDRVYNLVISDNLSVKQAKKRARYEIMNHFHMDTTGVSDPEDLMMLDTAAGSAELLALTVLLQGDRSEADFMEIVTEFADDIVSDGKWDDANRIKELAEWAKEADQSGRLDEIRERLVKGTDGTAFSDFIKCIRNFWQKELRN